MSDTPVPDPMPTKTVIFSLDELVTLGRALEVRLSELNENRTTAKNIYPENVPHWEKRIAETRTVYEKLENTPWRFTND